MDCTVGWTGKVFGTMSWAVLADLDQTWKDQIAMVGLRLGKVGLLTMLNHSKSGLQFSHYIQAAFLQKIKYKHIITQARFLCCVSI